MRRDAVPAAELRSRANLEQHLEQHKIGKDTLVIYRPPSLDYPISRFIHVVVVLVTKLLSLVADVSLRCPPKRATALLQSRVHKWQTASSTRLLDDVAWRESDMWSQILFLCILLSSLVHPPSPALPSSPAVPGVPQEKAVLTKELHEKSSVLAGVKNKTKLYVEKLNADKFAAIGALEAQVGYGACHRWMGRTGEVGACFFFFCVLYVLRCFHAETGSVRSGCDFGGSSIEGWTLVRV